MNATGNTDLLHYSENTRESLPEFFLDAATAERLFTFAAVTSFLTAFVGGIILYVVSIRFGRNYDKRSISLHICSVVGFIVSFFIFFGSFLSLSQYSSHLEVAQQYEYFGPMRVTSHPVFNVFLEVTSCNKGGCTEATFADATVKVDWGHAWACPADPAVSCQSDVRVCKKYVCWEEKCDDNQIDKAFEKLEDCIRENRYEDDMVSIMPSPFDRKVPPSRDTVFPNWPKVNAYGDCETCQSTLSVPSNDNLDHEKKVGSILFFVALSLLILSAALQLRILCRGNKLCCLALSKEARNNKLTAESEIGSAPRKSKSSSGLAEDSDSIALESVYTQGDEGK